MQCTLCTVTVLSLYTVSHTINDGSSVYQITHRLEGLPWCSTVQRNHDWIMGLLGSSQPAGSSPAA